MKIILQYIVSRENVYSFIYNVLFLFFCIASFFTDVNTATWV